MDTTGQVIRMGNMREGYVAIVKAVADYGEKVSPRGQETREFQCATLIVEDPYDTLPTGVGRGLVPGIAAVESAQLLAGESRPKLTISIGPMFENFTEKNGLFHGAYGPRTAGQFRRAEARLKEDASSRQAVVTIWDKDRDLLDNQPKKDFPCTIMYHFMLRDDKLIMEVIMRSNDVILGLCYDAFQHSRVQIAMAAALGVEPGEYRHHAMSLHLYERDLDKVDQLKMPGKAPTFMPALTGKTFDDAGWKAQHALDVVENPYDNPYTIGEDRDFDWYVHSMREAISKNKTKEMQS